MRNGIILSMFAFLSIAGCKSGQQDEVSTEREIADLNLEQASRLAELPLDCMQTDYPNKLGHILGSEQDLGEPLELHPAFYGCFDWHSAVHAHWLGTFALYALRHSTQ